MAILVLIQGDDLNITPDLKDYVEKKVSRLDHYLPSINEARVELAEQKSARSPSDREVAQLTVMARGVVLRAEERNEDIFAAVDAVLDKMQRQIERYKGKRRRQRVAAAAGAIIEAEAEEAEEQAELDLETEEDEPAGVVARRKRFTLTPMDEAEAIEQMRLLGHEEFFVFYNTETNRINVLYRRKNGDYGLIDPEIG
jgi:putative sigma-54 modulation protein